MKNGREMFIAENIRYLRKTRNMTLEELGKKLGKGLSTVGKWETGDSKPTLDVLIKLMCIFNVSLDNLIFVNLELYSGDYSVSAFVNSNPDIKVTDTNEINHMNEYRKLDDEHKQRLAELIKFYINEQNE